MNPLKHVATPMAAAAMLAAGCGVAAADGPASATAERATIVPLSQILRRCDFSDDTHVASTGTGRAVAIVSTTGSAVTAEVQLENAAPGIRYFVRLIEVPPPTSRCRPGNPGVTAATIDTDGGGNGNLTLEEAVLPGETGAWVFIEGPPGDFFSSDFVAPI